MANVGEAVIKLTFDGKSMSADLDKTKKEVESKAGGIGEKLKSGLGSAGKAAAKTIAALAAAGGAAIVGLSKKSLELGADWEQQVGGAETLFKDAANDVLANAGRAFDTAQISQNEYMHTVTSFAAAMTTSLGGNMTKAAQMADQAVIDMADNANKMGTDMASLQWAYQGFAKQNYTMLDNLKLGYGGTKSEMERLLADAGKIAGTKFDIGNFADVTQAIHVMQVQMGIAGTSAKEGTETVSGSLNRLKASWSDLLTVMTVSGGDSKTMNKYFKEVIENVKIFGKNVLPMLKQVLGGIANLAAELLPEAAQAIAEMLPAIIPDLAKAISDIVVALANALPQSIAALVQAIVAIAPDLVTALITCVTAVVGMLPKLMPQIIQLITGIANALTAPQNLMAIIKAGIILFMELVKAVPQIAGALIQSVGSLINSVVTIIGEGFGPAGTFIGQVMSGIGALFGQIGASLGAFLSQIWAVLSGVASTVYNIVLEPIANFVSNVFIAIVAIVSNLIQGVINVVAPIVSWVYNTILAPIMNFVGTTTAFIRGVFSTLVSWLNYAIINPIRNFFNGLWNNVRGAAAGAVNGIRGVFGALAGWFNGVVISPIRNAFNRLGDGIKAVFNAVRGAIQKTFSTIGGVVKAPVNGIISGANGLISRINSLKVPDWVPGIGGKSPHFGLLPRLAQGGYANGETGAIIGEAGREVVIPLERNTDNWSGLLASALSSKMEAEESGASGRPITVQMTNEINNEMDANDIGRLLMQSIRRAA